MPPPNFVKIPPPKKKKENDYYDFLGSKQQRYSICEFMLFLGKNTVLSLTFF